MWVRSPMCTVTVATQSVGLLTEPISKVDPETSNPNMIRYHSL